jgi:hypothetical protein
MLFSLLFDSGCWQPVLSSGRRPQWPGLRSQKGTDSSKFFLLRRQILFSYFNPEPIDTGIRLWCFLCSLSSLGLLWFCSAWIRIILGSWIRICISEKSWIRIHIRGKSGSGSRSALKSKFRSFRGSKWRYGGPLTLTMEAWRLKMEPWRVHRPVIVDSHDWWEQEPDPH